MNTRNPIAPGSRLPATMAAIVATVATLVLCGWFARIPTLTTLWVTEPPSMKANTAMCLLGLALALGIRCREPLTDDPDPGSRSRIVLVSLTSAVAAATLLQDILGIDIGIDQCILADFTGSVDGGRPGRMAPVTAMCTLLCSAALGSGSRRQGRALEPREAIASLGLVIALLAALELGFGARILLRLPGYTTMAWHTATCFMILFTGTLLAWPREGFMRTVTSDHLGGRNFRRYTLPMAALMPMLGYLRLQGERHGYYGTETGVALLVCSSVVVILAAGIVGAKFLDLADMQSESSLEILGDLVEEQTASLREKEREALAARDEALKASRVKSEFLANMSHEIRTPLNGVLGLTDLLLSTPLTPEQQNYLDPLRQSGKTLLRLIDDILEATKLEAQEFRLILAPFDTKEVMASVMKLMSPLAETKRLLFELELTGDSPGWLVGDEHRLRQVITNLVSNALKFTEKGRVLVRYEGIACDPDHVQLRVCVIDTGSGVPEELGPQLFQKFSQAGGSITRKHGGTGLGLAISKQIVEKMGGRIGHEGSPSGGSMFWFELPLERAVPPPTGMLADKHDPGVSAGGLRALVVDDNGINRLLATSMLRKLGCVVSEAASGDEALRASFDTRFDAVFLDCRMPGMDGYEVTRRLRTPRLGAATPAEVRVIGVTASVMSGEKQRCLEAGMDDYMPKPVSWQEFRRALAWRAPAGQVEAAATVLAGQVEAAATVLAGPPPQLDYGRLERLLDTLGVEAVQEAVQLLLRIIPGRISELRQAMEIGDRSQISAIAHSIVGSSRNLGLTGLASLAARLEAYPLEAPAESLSALATEVEQMAMESQRTLETWMRGVV